MLDLRALAVVDNHCHAFWRGETPLTTATFRAAFTEARRDGPAPAFVAQAVYYRWALKELARVLHCRPIEEEVLAQRARLPLADLVSLLFAEAHIDTLLIDTGLTGADFRTVDEMRALTGCRVEWMLRLEVLAQDLVLTCNSFAEFAAGLRRELHGLRARGVVSLKSIAAYRSGLRIEEPSAAAAAQAFAEAKAVARRDGALRLVHKPLIDYVVHRGMEQAAEEGLPVQFHTGYGDPDTDLRLGNPLHLRPLFEHPAYATVPIILLHESYPFTREAGYLAAVYANAYLDLSYAVPFLDYHELLSCTRQALGAAPWSKVLYSSDGFGIPEHAWLGAVHGRRVLAAALDEKIAVGELDEQEARAAAEAILAGNSRRVYRL